MELTTVEELIKPYLEENNLILFSIDFKREYGYKILRVLVDKKGGITLDELALVNHYLSEKLDEFDQEMGEYMLEVSSPGAEKPLRNLEEVLENIGAYINVKTSDMVYEGYLEEVNGEILNVLINVKGRKKTIKIEYADIKKIRLAVKM